MIQYSKSISYFTKATIIDPEYIYNLNNRAITYYILQEYDKVLSDLDKVIQLDPLNSLAYYLKSITYYAKKDINNAKIIFVKYAELELNSDNIFAKIHQLFHLEYLLKKNSSEDLNNILTKINQILYINNSSNKLLLLIRCKINIELKKYHEAKLDLDMLYELNRKYFERFEYISHIYLSQKYTDFWLYFFEACRIKDKDFNQLGIINKFNKYMFKGKIIFYFIKISNSNNINMFNL